MRFSNRWKIYVFSFYCIRHSPSVFVFVRPETFFFFYILFVFHFWNSFCENCHRRCRRRYNSTFFFLFVFCSFLFAFICVTLVVLTASILFLWFLRCVFIHSFFHTFKQAASQSTTHSFIRLFIYSVFFRAEPCNIKLLCMRTRASRLNVMPPLCSKLKRNGNAKRKRNRNRKEKTTTTQLNC